MKSSGCTPFHRNLAPQTSILKREAVCRSTTHSQLHNCTVTVRIHKAKETSKLLSTYLSGSMRAVAIFQKPHAIPPCFSIDFVLYFSLSWLLVLLPSMFF
jgi:hypothetical protein